QLAGSGAGDGNGFYAAGRTHRPPGPEAHLSGAACIAADWQLRAAGTLRRRAKLSRSERLSFGLVAGRLRQAAAVAAASAGRGPDAALDRCRTFSGIPAHAAPLSRTGLKLALLGTNPMTRSMLNATMRRVYALLALVLAISVFAKFVDHIPPLRGSGLEAVLKDAYEFLRDMSLLIATGGVAYITNVYQRRSSFIAALKEEWRDIIAAKSALFSYTQLERPTLERYLATFCQLSETIDNMRSVYQNVGETGELVGLYPYAPLHDMRRALQTLDPRKNAEPGAEARALVRDAILQSFYALRETFLEELDLAEPDRPLLISAGRRDKASGATAAASRRQARQRARQDRAQPADRRIEELLTELNQREQETAKPWRHPAPAGAPANGHAG